MPTDYIPRFEHILQIPLRYIAHIYRPIIHMLSMLPNKGKPMQQPPKKKLKTMTNSVTIFQPTLILFMLHTLTK